MYIMDYKKLFRFIPQSDWSLSLLEESSTNTSQVQSDKHMMKMKEELNNVKNKLCDYDIADWGQHTTRMDPASKVVRVVGSTIRPKPFCTNAWCKFYELLSTLRLLDEVDKSIPLHSMHLCEAPGGFVCALNHFIQTEYRGMQHAWLANTLNPYHEKCRLGVMIDDDRLIRHSMDRWLFGEDNTGDLTKPANIRHIIQEAREYLGTSIQLVTADGSLDCQLRPAEQEMVVYPLILAEVYTALSLLSPGGVAVFKMFTLYENQTIALLYSLNLLFKQVETHKPVTSKPGNSEVYVVCKGRVPTISDHIMSLFTSAMDSGLPLLSLSQIPESFLQQVRAAADDYKQRQVETILHNVRCYDNKKLMPVISNEKLAREFISVMKLGQISADLSVVSTSERAGYVPYREELTVNCYGAEATTNQWQARKRRLSGNFTQRCNNTVEHRLRRLVLADEHSTQPIRFLYAIETCCPRSHSPIDACEAISPVRVPTLKSADTRIHSCCFSDASLLSDYNILADSSCDIIVQNTGPDDVDTITRLVTTSLSDYQQIVYIASQEQTEVRHGKANKLIISNSPASNLQSLLSIFMVMRTGDHLLVHNINCLLRLGAGVVYLLWHCFDEVAIAGHNTVTHLPSILFKRCIVSDGERSGCMELLQQRLISTLTDDWTILTLVPTPTIIHCKKLHNSFLCDVNNETLRRAINDLVSRTKSSLKAETT